MHLFNNHKIEQNLKIETMKIIYLTKFYKGRIVNVTRQITPYDPKGDWSNVWIQILLLSHMDKEFVLKIS